MNNFLKLTISEEDYQFLEDLQSHLYTWVQHFNGLDKVFAKKDLLKLTSILEDLATQVKLNNSGDES